MAPINLTEWLYLSLKKGEKCLPDMKDCCFVVLSSSVITDRNRFVTMAFRSKGAYKGKLHEREPTVDVISNLIVVLFTFLLRTLYRCSYLFFEFFFFCVLRSG